MDTPDLSALDARLRGDEDALITLLRQAKQSEERLNETRSGLEMLNARQHSIAALARRAAEPFVGGGEVVPPVGKPADFWDEAYAKDNPFYTGADLRERLERDALAVPGYLNNEGYATAGRDFLSYWLFGLSDYLRASEAARGCGVDPRRVFDFGGSTGRVARHFYCQEPDREVWWCDFKTASVEWCLRYLPSQMRVFLNTFLPHLPIADGYFDLVTAFSVFTHIDEMETSWLLELKRVLRPGGVAYLTIHDETTWSRLDPQGGLAVALRKSPRGAAIDFGQPLPDTRIAFTFTQETHYNCNVFHTSEYIRNNWGRFFEIVQIIPTAHWEQAVVVCVNR